MILVVFCWMLAGFAVAGESRVTGLRFLDSKRILAESEGLREPSGMVLAADGKHLWVVSDNISRIFLIGLDGDLKPDHTIKVRLSGGEAITAGKSGEYLLAVSEDTSEIVSIDLRTRTASRIALDQMAGYQAIANYFTRSSRNDGLEGITINLATGEIFLLKEKNPRLIIEISPDLLQIRGVLPLTADMGFLDSDVSDDVLDVSDIAYDAKRGAFWISSDTGKRLFLFDPKTMSAEGWPLTTSTDGHRMNNAEGVALSEDGRNIYVVNDDGKDSRLVKYAIE